MIIRRWPIVVLVVAALVAFVVVGRNPPTPAESVFSQVATPWMPAVQAAEGVGSTWFCPGVPAAGVTGTAGEIVAVNPTGAPMRAVISALGVAPSSTPTTTVAGDAATTVAAPASTTTVDIAAGSVHRQNVAELVNAPFAAVVVEFSTGGGFVEQVATTPVGDSSASSVSACATSPSSTWYFAAGNTENDSVDTLVVSNPYDHSAVIDVSVDTPRGPRQIADALPVAAQSVRTIDLTAVIADQPWIGVVVEASRGGVVVGRSQTYGTPTLSGYSMTLGSPTLGTHWWFGYGQKAADVTTRFVIYNPGDDTVTVTPVPVGAPLATTDPVASIDIAAGTVHELDPATLPQIADGSYSMVLTTAEPDQLVVVERVVTRVIDGVSTTGVTMGGLSRPDGSLPTTWYVGVPFGEATPGGLQLLNTASSDSAVSVQAVRPEGLTPVPGLTGIAVAAGATAVVDITDPAAIGVPLVLTATTPVIVERVIPREPGAQGRVVTWAVPSAV